MSAFVMTVFEFARADDNDMAARTRFCILEKRTRPGHQMLIVRRSYAPVWRICGTLPQRKLRRRPPLPETGDPVHVR